MATVEAFGPLLSCRNAAPISRLRGSAGPRLLLPVISCKSRSGRGGSRTRKHRDKKAPSKHPQLNLNRCSDEKDKLVAHKVVPVITSNFSEESKTHGDFHGRSACVTDEFNSAGEKRITRVQNEDIIDRIPNHFEDLLSMMKTAEKNVFLLDEARLQALEDVEGVRAEKEMLEKHFVLLKMKLSETDKNDKAAARGRKHSSLLESQFRESKENESSRKIEDHGFRIHVNGNNIQGSEVPASGVTSLLSLTEEQNVLRKENLLLKDTIQNLEAELSLAEETNKYVGSLEKETSVLKESVRDLQRRIAVAQQDVSELPMLQIRSSSLLRKVESLEGLIASATEQAGHAVKVIQQNDVLQSNIKRLEASLKDVKINRDSSEKAQYTNEILHQRVKTLEDHLQKSEEEINSHVQLYEAAMRDFQHTLGCLKEESKKKLLRESTTNGFWSRLLLMVDGWLLEKKLSLNDTRSLREMIRRKDIRVRDTYLAFKDNDQTSDSGLILTFVKLAQSPR